MEKSPLSEGLPALAPHTIDLGKASIETKGGGAYPQPDTNQPSRQAFGIQDD